MPRISKAGSSADVGPERTRPNYPTEAQRRAALKLFKSGKGYKSVSTLLGLAEGTVRDWGRAYRKGCFSVHLHINQYRYSDEMRERVAALRAQGLSWKAVSEATGVSISTCRLWCGARKKD